MKLTTIIYRRPPPPRFATANNNHAEKYMQFSFIEHGENAPRKDTPHFFCGVSAPSYIPILAAACVAWKGPELLTFTNLDNKLVIIYKLTSGTPQGLIGTQK
jgi:hypothetical protein